MPARWQFMGATGSLAAKILSKLLANKSDFVADMADNSLPSRYDESAELDCLAGNRTGCLRKHGFFQASHGVHAVGHQDCVPKGLFFPSCGQVAFTLATVVGIICPCGNSGSLHPFENSRETIAEIA